MRSRQIIGATILPRIVRGRRSTRFRRCQFAGVERLINDAWSVADFARQSQSVLIERLALVETLENDLVQQPLATTISIETLKLRRQRPD
jgi:hypothetical protein